jgi:hypothetical protein
MPKIVCSKCGEKKDEDQFRADIRGRDGRRTECYECESKAAKERYRRRRDEECLSAVEETTSSKDKMFGTMVEALMNMARYEKDRLKKITPQQFYARHEKSDEYALQHAIPYEDIENEAASRLTEMFGLEFDRERRLEKGVYLIVGDSHGKHTPHETFDLLQNLQEHFNFKNIIHVGHILDDDGLISYRWKDFDNFIVVPKMGEVRGIIQSMKKEKFSFDIVHDRLYTDHLDIRSQDFFMNEYTDTSITNINQNLMHRHTIMNFHRHEMDGRNTPRDRNLMYMAPGCLCDVFVTQVRKIKDWVSGGTMKEAWTSSMPTYQRRHEIMNLWEKGVIILHVDSKGEYTPVMCRIYDLDDEERGIGYFEVLVTSKGIYESDQMDLITADMHVPLHEPKVLSIIDKMAEDYRFTNHINLGDACHNISVNHHNLDRRWVMEYANVSLLWESAYTSFILGKSAKWADNNYLIYANHERFLDDFFKKYPQFKEMFDVNMLYNLGEHGIELIPLKDYIKLRNVTYIHGDIKHFGLGGRMLDRNAKNFDSSINPVVQGHSHYSAIRSGSYAIGLCGKLDQKYNEVNSSRWNHGFGIASSHGERTWVTTIPILFDNLYLNGKHYRGSNDSKWVMDDFKATIHYEF